jgi:hypothetical protein
MKATFQWLRIDPLYIRFVHAVYLQNHSDAVRSLIDTKHGLLHGCLIGSLVCVDQRGEVLRFKLVTGRFEDLGHWA